MKNTRLRIKVTRTFKVSVALNKKIYSIKRIYLLITSTIFITRLLKRPDVKKVKLDEKGGNYSFTCYIVGWKCVV